MTTDYLIKQYAERLKAVYNGHTAADFTFEGILAEFARNLLRGTLRAPSTEEKES